MALVFLHLYLVTFSQTLLNQGTYNKKSTENPVYKGTAVVITGAAARIPQEAALLERLYKTGALKDVAIITGVSSGALNTVMLNAILKGDLTWEQYKNILFSISNDQVFIREGNKLPLDTRPLRSLISKIVNNKLGYFKMGDLPYPSALSATNVEIIPFKERTFRFSNLKINNESNSEYNLVDILMASTAIPLVFPKIKLNFSGFSKPVTFMDGGVAEDHIPYKAVIEYEEYTGTKINRMIIVSRKSNLDKDVSSELNDIGIKDTKLLEDLGISLQRFSKEGFINSLKHLQKNYPDLASRTYVYIPDFDEFFSILNFNTIKEQYQVSASWATTHQPVPLARYLEEFQTIK